MQVRQAQLEDIDPLKRLFAAAVMWQQGRGVPTFADFSTEFLHREIENGHVYVGLVGEELIGTISLYESDAMIWDGDASPALYIHRLASAKTSAGRGAGSSLIKWAHAKAIEMGKALLRVDCWARNSDLCEYYISQGFTVVRERDTGADASLPTHYHNIRLMLFEMSVGG